MKNSFGFFHRLLLSCFFFLGGGGGEEATAHFYSEHIVGFDNLTYSLLC